MKTLLLRVCAVALALLAVPLVTAPAAAQSDMNAYKLMTNGTSSGALTAPPGTYNLQLPATFNGATITVTFTTANGTVSSFAYTSAPSPTPCFHTSAGTTVSVAAAGGTPTGTTYFAGNTRCGTGDASPTLMDTVVKATPTDRGLVVTTAGTAQQMMAANTARRGFVIQNQSSGACYISSLGTATQDYHSLQIGAGAYYETSPTFVSTGAISIICATSSASIFAQEF